MADAVSPDAVSHLKALIACPSVTPAEAGALDYLEGVLADLGFNVERRTFTDPASPDVENLFATIGSGEPHLVFAGHTDVVLPGDEAAWSRPPFAAIEDDGILYGRGAVDMKGGIACFLAAAAQRLDGRGLPRGQLSLLITGDEEGLAVNGTVKMLGWALGQGHHFDAALVGEPTSQGRVGDTMKIGRRGSLSGVLTITGRQGHSAYPDLADNPMPGLVRALAALTALEIDTGTEAFQPSDLQITAVDTGNTAANVIPGSVRARFNVRFNDARPRPAVQELIARTVAESGARNAEIAWVEPVAEAFVTGEGALSQSLSEAIGDQTGLQAQLSTGGGTSDARFFKDVCPVVECGLVGATMHQVDERVAVADLAILTSIYAGFLNRFFEESKP